MDFMRAYALCIHSHLFHIYGQFPDTLNRVRMESYILRSANFCQFPDGIDGAYLIIDVHQAVDCRIVCYRFFPLFRVELTAVVRREVSDADSRHRRALLTMDHCEMTY